MVAVGLGEALWHGIAMSTCFNRQVIRDPKENEYEYLSTPMSTFPESPQTVFRTLLNISNPLTHNLQKTG